MAEGVAAARSGALPSGVGGKTRVGVALTFANGVTLAGAVADDG